MQQQVNFYLLLPQQNKHHVSLQKMMFAYGVFIFLLFVLTLWDIGQNYKKSKQLTIFKNELATEKKQVATLTAQYPMLNPKDLEASMQNLQRELEMKNKMVALLSQRSGFSMYLSNIAKASVRGAWLTDISISMQDMQIGLKGQALQATSVHQFLNQLVHQSEFVNMPLELRELISTGSANNSYLGFFIATKAAT